MADRKKGQREPVASAAKKCTREKADGQTHSKVRQLFRTRLRSEQSRLQGADRRRRFQDQPLSRHAARARARNRSQRAGKLWAKRLPNLTTLIRICAVRKTRILATTGVRHWERPPPRPACGAGAKAAIRRSDQYPIHRSHHRGRPKARR
jgi:hypothetical protein